MIFEDYYNSKLKQLRLNDDEISMFRDCWKLAQESVISKPQRIDDAPLKTIIMVFEFDDGNNQYPVEVMTAEIKHESYRTALKDNGFTHWLPLPPIPT